MFYFKSCCVDRLNLILTVQQRKSLENPNVIFSVTRGFFIFYDYALSQSCTTEQTYLFDLKCKVLKVLNISK